jgi:hypothetical protein
LPFRGVAAENALFGFPEADLIASDILTSRRSYRRNEEKE